MCEGDTVTRTRRTKGPCGYCGRVMTCTGLGRHLRACGERRAPAAGATAGNEPREVLHHLQVADTDGLGCRLHLEMNGSATLLDLDLYLRRIWLECCGHLSAFRIAGAEYSLGDELGWGEERSIDEVAADDVFGAGLTFTYQYDFGTTTQLSLRCLDQRRGQPTTAHPIRLMARNDPVEVPCGECGKPARSICMDCLYEGETESAGYVCEDHAVAHATHDDYGSMMPLFNSPRTGVCAYDGPAEPPY